MGPISTTRSRRWKRHRLAARNETVRPGRSPTSNVRDGPAAGLLAKQAIAAGGGLNAGSGATGFRMPRVRPRVFCRKECFRSDRAARPPSPEAAKRSCHIEGASLAASVPFLGSLAYIVETSSAPFRPVGAALKSTSAHFPAGPVGNGSTRSEV